MKSLNFEMLRDNWSELSDFGAYAEKYLYSDPQSSVVKLRCFIESLVPTIYQKLSLSYDAQWDLYSALKNQEFQDIIDKQILKKFHAIRIKANKAIHNNTISLSDTKWLLKETHFIACWFYGIYTNSDVKDLQQFILPAETLEKINLLELTVKELEKTIEYQKEKNSQIIHVENERNENLQWFEAKNKKVANALNLNDEEINKRITLEEIYADYQLNSGQQELIKELGNFLKNPDSHIFLLKGYAGTGKTFITKGFTEYLTSIGRKFVLAAPTGKAAKVIKEKTKNEAFTIHKTIYSYKDLKEYKVENIDGTETFKFYFDLNDNTHDGNTVYIIDEASMISDKINEGEFFRFGSGRLLSDLIKYIHFDHNDHDKKIIFIGDTAQLPPIGMNFSPALDSVYIEKEFNLKCNSYELTEIMRQSVDSGIVENSLAIRESIRRNTYNQLDINLNFEDTQHVEHENLLGQYLDSCGYKINGDSIIIAHSNTVVDEYNSQIRKHFFPNQDFITVGDKVMAIANNGSQEIFIYNGDFGLIRKVDENIIKREAIIREKINEQLTITTRVPLWFRKVEIGFRKIEDNKPHFLNCLIFENILYRDIVYKDTNFRAEINKYDLKIQDINRLETVALYVDFVNRSREKGLNPNTDEFKQAIKSDEYFNSLKLKFGYALTCHKAQGSEWNNVFVNCHTHENILTKGYFRWLYTAITRSSKKLYLMDEPHVTMIGGFKNIQPLTEETANTGISENTITFIEEKVKRVCEALGVDILDIQHHRYLELYTFKRNDAIQRVQIHYNGKNKITRVICVDNDVLLALMDELKKSLLNVIVYEEQDNKNQEFTFTEEFLKEFYNVLQERISTREILIIDIRHMSYCERYTFKKEENVAVIDFWYNGNKQFRRAPQPQQNFSVELVNEIYEALR